MNFLDPEKALKQLKLKPNMVAADFGAGSGGWVIPLAKRLEDGKVYAVDILQDPLSALQVKAVSEKIFNIKTIVADIEQGTGMHADSCDVILISNLLFQVDDKKKVLQEAQRVLRRGGSILVVDWNQDAAIGPEGGRISADEVKEISKELGFKVEKTFEASPYHWGLILAK